MNKKPYLCVLLLLGLGEWLTAGPSYAAQRVQCGTGATVEIVNGVVVCTVTKTIPESKPCGKITFAENIPVYYISASQIRSVLEQSKVDCGSVLKSSDNQSYVIVDGNDKAIKTYRNIIARLDLPRERVHMDMLGIQISSSDPERLADVMEQVKREVDLTRTAMAVTYDQLTSLARNIPIRESSTTQEIRDLGFGQLFSQTGKDGMQRISFSDALMRINFANTSQHGSRHGDYSLIDSPYPIITLSSGDQDQIDHYNQTAYKLCSFFAEKGSTPLFAGFTQFEGRQQLDYATRRVVYGDRIPLFRRPFQRFQEVALHQEFPSTSTPRCDDGFIRNSPQERPAPGKVAPGKVAPGKVRDQKAFTAGSEQQDLRTTNVVLEWTRRQNAVFYFLKAYSLFQSEMRSSGVASDPQCLAITASQLDGLLSPLNDALNQDIEEYFMRPTLHRIKKIVGRYRNVEYAEVGRTTVAGLNGLMSEVSSTTGTSFDEPTPLRLNNLIKDASEAKSNVDKLLPGLSTVPLATGATPIDASSALAVLAALSKEETRWRELTSGVKLAITPTVFRDRTAAQLDVDLVIGDPAIKNESISKDNPLRPGSRISQSTLRTKVYVNTMDLFALTAFNNQTTVTGRRWNVPLIGPIWEGVFGDIPVFGNLLSPLRPPTNVQHQSIVLANTLIVPTAMGLTEWYQGNRNQSVNQTGNPPCYGYQPNLPWYPPVPAPSLRRSPS